MVGLLSSAGVVGVCGSRRVVPPVVLVVLRVLLGLRCVVGCGCCRGVAACVRVVLGRARVFRAGAFGGSSPASRLVARSVAFVRWVAGSPSGLWVSFPAGSCPRSCLPGASWSSCGSGSWSSLALAVGLRVPALVWLPASVPAPWGCFVSLGGGWWFCEPGALQLELF